MRKDGEIDRKLIVCLEGIPLTSGRRLALKPQSFSFFLPMSQMKFGVSHIARRLFKSAATSALALSALAGGVILTGGDAKALECKFAGGGFTIPGCQYGVWYETNPVPTDKDIWFISGPTTGSGTVDWYWQDVNQSGTWLIPPDPHSVDQWHVDVNFKPNDLFPADGPSFFSYVVIIDKGQGGSPHNPWNPWFEDVSLDSNISQPTPGGVSGVVEKSIWEAVCTPAMGTFNSCSKGKFLGKLTNKGILPLDPGIDKLYIEDLATPNNSTIDNYQNVFRQTPGPLPILGAGAAYGFSRKLRGRIKASRTA